jgi:hypothetical protein
MPSPKLIAIITALTCLAGASGAYAAASAEQLAQIEELIIARNCAGLRAYLVENPALLEGDDPLAEELRDFASGIDSGLISCLSFRSGPGVGDLAADPEAAGAPGAGGAIY